MILYGITACFMELKRIKKVESCYLIIYYRTKAEVIKNIYYNECAKQTFDDTDIICVLILYTVL